MVLAAELFGQPTPMTEPHTHKRDFKSLISVVVAEEVTCLMMPYRYRLLDPQDAPPIIRQFDLPILSGFKGPSVRDESTAGALSKQCVLKLVSTSDNSSKFSVVSQLCLQD